MRTRVLAIAALVALIVLALAGCGGGGRQTSDVPALKSETGGIKIAVQWPDGSRAIPAEAQRISITVAGAGINSTIWEIERPQSETTIEGIPVGTRYLKAEAFGGDHPEGESAPLAVGKTSVQVQKGAVASATIELRPLTPAEEQLESGRYQLFSAMFGDGTDASLAAALAAFREALRLDSSLSEAHFGYGVAKLLSEMRKLEGKYPDLFGDDETGGTGESTPPPVIAAVVSAALDFSKMAEVLKSESNPFRLALTRQVPGFTLPSGRSRSAATDMVAYQADMKNALPIFDQVAVNMAEAESDPAFSFRLSPGQWYYERGGMLVDQGDVYLFDGLIRAYKALVMMGVSYSADAGTWDFEQRTSTHDANGDGVMPPAEWLPSNPFLTLTDRSMMVAARSVWQAACDKAIAGLDLLAGQSPYSYDTTGWLYLSADDFAALKTIVQQVKQSLSSPVTLPLPGNSGGNLQVYLGAWFDNPPTDLKALAPTLRVEPDGSTSIAEGAFPDPTFGGLFPGGLPALLLYAD